MESEPVIRRRSGRRRRRDRGTFGSLRSFWQDKRKRRWVLIGIGAILGLLLLLRTLFFWVSYQTYLDTAYDARRVDVLYSVGTPTQMLDAGRWVPARGAALNSSPAWAFALPTGARVEAHFDADDRVETLSCESELIQLHSCPELFRHGIGTREDTLTWRLGAPDEIAIGGGVKAMSYNAIGARYELKQFAVFRIVKTHPRGGFGSVVRIWLSHLLPKPPWSSDPA